MQNFSSDLNLIRSTYQPREVFSLDKITINSKNPFILSEFRENNWIFDYFGHLKGCKNLVVIFTCAQAADFTHVLQPYFMRWSWVDNFPFPDADVLCIADPTMRLNSNLLGGWFQGTKHDWILIRILYHIAYLQYKYQYKKIIFSSGSLGGFASIQAATLLPIIFKNLPPPPHNKNKLPIIKVCLENPQICFQNFHEMYDYHATYIANVCYGVDKIEKVETKYLERLDAVELIKKHRVIPSGLIMIRESDTHHYNVHIKYLQEEILHKYENNLKVEVIPAHLDNTGHGGFKKEQLKIRLDYLNCVDDNYYLDILEHSDNFSISISDVVKNNKNIQYSATMILIEADKNDINILSNLLPQTAIFIDSRKSKLHKINSNRISNINYSLYNATLNEFNNFDNQKITSLDNLILTNKITLKPNIFLNINIDTDTNFDNILPILRGALNTLTITNVLLLTIVLDKFTKSIPTDLAIFLHSLNFKCIKLFSNDSNNLKVKALFIQK